MPQSAHASPCQPDEGPRCDRAEGSVSPTKWMLSAIGHPQLVRIKAATWVKLLAPIPSST